MRFLRKRYHEPGTAPGTLSAPESASTGPVSVTVIDYDASHLEEKQCSSLEEALAYRETPRTTWINIDGIHDVTMIQRIGEHFGLHPLSLEDVLNTGQRPKLEDYETFQFVVMKQLQWQGHIAAEQLSLFLGPRFVITFQERPGDVFDPVRDRLRKGKGRIRKMGSDYLAYALLDALVDEFFPILEKFGERIEDLEERVLEDPARETLEEVRDVKRDLLLLRRAAWPTREVINGLSREGSSLVRKETRVFLRDCYDHTIQIMDMIETFRDLTAGMLETYLSSVSNRMNEIMKVLTIMAAIFIPLTFIAGIYGMNFNSQRSPWNMPELDWYWGYPFAIFLMISTVVAMLVYFRRKKWL